MEEVCLCDPGSHGVSSLCLYQFTHSASGRGRVSPANGAARDRRAAGLVGLSSAQQEHKN